MILDNTQTPQLPQNAVSGSVLIAEFMKLPKLTETTWINPVLACSTDKLAYYESWGWIMPVVEKICKENFEDGEQVYLRTFGMINSEFKFMVRFQRHQLFCSETLLTATYLAVVDYLQNRP
jgi:hypothetical protein